MPACWLQKAAATSWFLNPDDLQKAQHKFKFREKRGPFFPEFVIKPKR